jgi:dTDP-4-amino-4,6-dideoxygalactose transaminase
MIKVSQGCLDEAELAAVREVFAAGYFGHSAPVVEFERALGEYLGAGHVVAVNTGTSALHLALDALGIGHGDEVVVPSLTYVACFQAVSATGARPVACEIVPGTLNVDVADAERRITPRTRALMPVHYAGAPCDLETLTAIAAARGLHVVEDAAHALGATRRGRRVGGGGDIACFSFDSIKNITCGEGGAIVCRDGALAERLREKRQLGVRRDSAGSTPGAPRGVAFDVVAQGFRYHMSAINAAIGRIQLGKLEGFVERRRAICRRYDDAFQPLGVVRPLEVDYREAAPHLYVVRVGAGRRDALMRFLRDADIETGINYAPNHLHAYYRQEGVSLPVTEAACREILTLPLHCALSDPDVERVIDEVRRFARS